MNRRLFIFFLLISGGAGVRAQQPSFFTDEDRDYRKGIELLQQEKYSSAQEHFSETVQRLMQQSPETSRELLMNARYYEALCSKELQRADAEYLFSSLTDEYEINPVTRRAHFQLGNIYFDQKKYSKALARFKNAEAADLSSDEQEEFRFRMAICYFFQKDFDKAAPLLAQLKDEQGEYYYPANYYYAYIAYKQNKLPEALKSFKIAGQSELYQPVVPYYLANISFLQKDFDQVIEQAQPLAQAGTSYSLEMQQLIGKSYFQKKQYDQALPYFTAYFNGAQKISKTDLYEIGFSQYKAKRYSEAIASLEQLNVLNDSLGQNALYLLADCYLNTDRKNDARLAFEKASKMKFDAVVREESAFQLSKLSHELGYHDAAVKELQGYIMAYPESPYKEEAKQYLAKEFLSTNNYRGALEVIEGIKVKTPELRRAYQKVAYSRATELYNEKNYSAAEEMMNRSLQNPLDLALQAGAYFWKGEAAFNQKKYNEAILHHEQFLALHKQGMKLPGEVTVTHSRYTMGYSHLQKGEYDQASKQFQSVKAALAGTTREDEKRLYADAVLRLADCSFVGRNYSAAVAGYQTIIDKKLGGIDYALYQKAIILGLQNKTGDKLSTLRTITNSFPSSLYVDDAWYELGTTYLSVPSYQEAAEAFSQVISNYSNGSYAVKSHLKLGLIYFNLNDNDRALKEYGTVLTRYPNSPEKAEALNGVKEVFTDRGDASGYMNYVKTLPNVSVSASTQDSVAYLVAEANYAKGDCAKSISEFSNYLTNFPSGAFALSAKFYRAECLSRQGEAERALADYEFVAAQSQNRFSDKAVLQAARTNYALKNYEKAFAYYSRLNSSAEFKSDVLEAARGYMYSAWQLGRYDDVANAANKILSLNLAGTEDRSEAHYYLAKVSYERGRFDEAFNEFAEVNKTSGGILGAEAAYRMAEIYFKKGAIRQAEEQCWSMIKKYPAQDYWIARAYLLIADVYAAQNDFFQAKATLQSVLDHYKGSDDVLPQARQKMEDVLKREAAQSKLELEGKENENSEAE